MQDDLVHLTKQRLAVRVHDALPDALRHVKVMNEFDTLEHDGHPLDVLHQHVGRRGSAVLHLR